MRHFSWLATLLVVGTMCRQLSAQTFEMPVLDDPAIVAKMNDPRTYWYSSDSHPRVFQFAGASPNTEPMLMRADMPLGSPDPGGTGQGNLSFPWRHPGGTDFAGNVATNKFVWLPPGKPIVLYRHREPIASDPGYINRIAWTFPEGAVIGEVLMLPVPAGVQASAPYVVFEVRIRIREADDWGVDIFRPDLSDLPTAGRVALTIRDQDHPNPAFPTISGTPRSLEPMSAGDVLQILQRPLESALGTDEYYTQDVQDFHVVPRQYTSFALGSDRDSCMRCHEHTAKSVDHFDLPRDWYGLISGSEGIFSWDPFDNRAKTGHFQRAILSQELLDSGMIAYFDAAQHSDYKRINLDRQSDIRRPGQRTIVNKETMTAPT